MSNFDIKLHLRVRGLIDKHPAPYRRVGEVLLQEGVNLVDLLEVVARQNGLMPNEKKNILVGAGIHDLSELMSVVHRAPPGSQAWHPKSAPYFFGYAPRPEQTTADIEEPEEPVATPE